VTTHQSPTLGESLAKLLAEQGQPRSNLAVGLEEKPLDVAVIEAPRTREIRFEIPGNPVGAPRMTVRDKWKKRPCVMRYREWKDLARRCAGVLPEANQILSLSWTAYFEPAASWSRKRRLSAIGTIHRAKPDRDNIDKAVLDSLFKEDSGIGVGSIAKYWSGFARLEVVIVVAD